MGPVEGAEISKGFLRYLPGVSEFADADADLHLKFIRRIRFHLNKCGQPQNKRLQNICCQHTCNMPSSWIEFIGGLESAGAASPQPCENSA